MKAHIYSVLVLLICLALVLPFAPVCSAAQDLQLANPRWPEGPAPVGEPAGPRQSPEGLWYVPEGSLTPAAASTSAPRATGGPDDFGYTWDDSVALNWIDATVGIHTGLSGERAYTGPVPIGFDFKYYENTYSELYITSSGFVSFDNQNLWVGQDQIPDPSLPNDVIAPYWSPLDANSGMSDGRIYYRNGGTAPNRWLAIEWHEVVESLEYDDTYTFEVILHENGDIVFQYLEMEYIGGYWCAAAGIEDSLGLDGLTTVQFCQQAPSFQAVRFYRPPSAARVKVRPLHQGTFTNAGETETFEVAVTNTGELGTDTYDLILSTSWPVSLYESDGITPLTDTDGDSDVDTGPVAEGATTSVMVKAETPGAAAVGDDNAALITIRSSLDTDQSRTASLRTAVPAPFAQVFRDDADGTMSLELVQPAGYVVRQATPDWTNAYDPSVAETASGFVHLWSQPNIEGNIYVREIEYALWDHVGRVTREAGKLTNHDGATIPTYDYQLAVAVAPNGRIGVAWLRALWDSSSSQQNYNIYLAVLDGAGTLIHGPTNVTNNGVWGHYTDYGVPQFYNPRIAATGDNRFVLAWTRYTNEAGGSVQDVSYAIRDTNGSEVVPVTTLTADWPGYDQGYRYPEVTRVGADRALLAWFQDGDDSIYYSVRDSAGTLIKAPTGLATGWSYSIDAVELSNGNILIAWSSSQPDAYRMSYAVLDAGYNLIAGPTVLNNDAALTGDSGVSVAADDEGHGIMTWMDNDYYYRPHLYYALVGPTGELLTDPMIFYASQAESPRVETNQNGYGNTSYSWMPPDDVDGDVAFASPLVGAPPGENVALGLGAANYGLTTATNFELVVTLDSELTYVGDNSGVTPNLVGNDVIWSLPDLAFFDSLDFRLIVQVSPGGVYGTCYPVTLTFTSDGPEEDPSNNTAAAEVMVAHRLFLPLVFRGF